MKNFLKKCVAAVLGLSLFATACNRQTDGGQEMTIEGIVLTENIVYLTKTSAAGSLAKDSLASLTFQEGTEPPAVGALGRFTLTGEIRESYPPQVTVTKVEEIKNPADIRDTDFDQAERLLGVLGSKAHLIDVRTADEYTSGHVGGAINLDLAVIGSRIGSVVSDKTDTVILYCRSGNRSGQAAKILRQQGYKVLFNAGGIMSYKGTSVKGSDPGVGSWQN